MIRNLKEEIEMWGKGGLMAPCPDCGDAIYTGYPCTCMRRWAAKLVLTKSMDEAQREMEAMGYPIERIPLSSEISHMDIWK